MAESREELKSLMKKMKEEIEKSWLKIQHSKNEDHGIWSHHFMANRNNGNSDRLFCGAPKSLQMVAAAMILTDASFIVQLSHPYMTIGKTISLTRRTFVGKVMALLFNRSICGVYLKES